MQGKLEARDKLAKLVQHGTVASYAEEFLSLVLAVPGMTEEEKVDQFTRGLLRQARKEVTLRECVTLQQAMTIASKVDALYLEAVGRANPGGRQRIFRPPTDEAVPMEIGQVREFSGECFNCGTWGHRASDCTQGPACPRGRGAGGRGRGRRPPERMQPRLQINHIEEESAEAGNDCPQPEG